MTQPEDPVVIGARAGDGPALWWLTVVPIVWIAHFLLSYVSVALWCARPGGPDSLHLVRLLVGGYTLLGLGGLAGFAMFCRRQQRRAGEASRRFLGVIGLLLCGLGAVAMLYVAMPMLYFTGCG